MNPQTTWDQLLCAYQHGDWDAIEKHATELIEWLDAGGVPPSVLLHMHLGPDFNRAVARAGCVFALQIVQTTWSTTSETTPPW